MECEGGNPGIPYVGSTRPGRWRQGRDLRSGVSAVSLLAGTPVYYSVYLSVSHHVPGALLTATLTANVPCGLIDVLNGRQIACSAESWAWEVAQWSPDLNDTAACKDLLKASVYRPVVEVYQIATRIYIFACKEPSISRERYLVP